MPKTVQRNNKYNVKGKKDCTISNNNDVNVKAA